MKGLEDWEFLGSKIRARTTEDLPESLERVGLRVKAFGLRVKGFVSSSAENSTGILFLLVTSSSDI